MRAMKSRLCEVILFIIPAAASAVARRCFHGRIHRGLEACGRESDPSEYIAGVISASIRVALFVRDAVIGCLNQELCGTLYSDYREYSEGNAYLKSALGVDKVIAYTTSYLVGQVERFAAITAAALLAHLRTEHHGLYGIYHRYREIGRYVAR